MMSEVISKNTVSESWDFEGRKENSFTGDHVIDAYLKGKKDGLKSAQRAVLQSLGKNVDKCALISHTIIEQLTKLNFFESTAFLKIKSWNSFKVLITIKEENFLDPKFLEVYDFVSEIEDNVCDNAFDVYFSFLDHNKQLNEDNLNADGYILKLRPRFFKQYKVGKYNAGKKERYLPTL